MIWRSSCAYLAPVQELGSPFRVAPSDTERRSRAGTVWGAALCVGFVAAIQLTAALGVISGCASETDCVNCKANDRVAQMPDPSPSGPNAPDAQSPGPVETLGPYGNCLDAPNACGAGASPHCLVDDRRRTTMGFCTSECDSTQECPRAPFGGTASPSCLSLGAERGECVLDCIAGQTCPDGMTCLPYGVCGYVTAEADNPYASCDECADDARCLSTSEGSVCFPNCTSPCPSPRNAGAMPMCIDANGEIGCALACDPLRPCRDGMRCAQYGFQSLCVWPDDDPCAQIECGRNADCEVVAGRAQCFCEPETFENAQGECVDPCDELDCHSTARCQVFGTSATCTCYAGEVMDESGRCDVPMTADPCDPNPCQGEASRCVESDGVAMCTCQDPTTTPPDCEQVCNATHEDGDEYEPNDCTEDAAVIGAGDAGLGISRVNADLGPMANDVDLYRLTEQTGYYWVLLESEFALCDLDFTPLPQRAEFGGFSYGAQLRADEQGGAFRCARSNAEPGMPYSLGVLRFAANEDLPPSAEFEESQTQPLLAADAPTGLATVFAVADRFEGGQDLDSFLVEVSLPLTMLYTGQSARVWVEVFDTFGELISQQQEDCGFRLEPSACFQVEGAGPAFVSVALQQGDDAPQSELDAWWMGY